MNLLFLAELFAVGGGLLVLLAFASWDWLRDVAARRRMNVLIAVEVARSAEDREVAELDAVYELPAFGGWRS